MTDVIEVDGPCSSEFVTELFDGTSERRPYVMLGLKSRNVDCLVRAMNDTIVDIKYQICTHDNPIIYWRQRPTIKHDSDGYYTIMCRLTTNPKLPDSFWSQLGKDNNL